MGHDPPRAAAAYLVGELGRRQRERLEAHLLTCEACWQEVQAARRGRALAESAREVAPQHLRDRVRATVEATPAGRARWAVRWAPLAAAVTLIAAVAACCWLIGSRLSQLPSPPPSPATRPAPRPGAAQPTRHPSSRSVICAGAARAAARWAACRWWPMPTRTPPATASCCSKPTGRSHRDRRPPPSRQRYLGERSGRGGAVLHRPSHAIAGGRPGPRHGAGGRRAARPRHRRACRHAMSPRRISDRSAG